jgi:hypothetical protein
MNVKWLFVDGYKTALFSRSRALILDSSPFNSMDYNDKFYGKSREH